MNAGKPSAFTYTPPVVAGQVLILRDMGDGIYVIHWYDPQKGNWLDSIEVTAQGNQLSIPIPDFNRDLAAKIEKKR